MDPITAGALITFAIPFVTAGLKKLFTKNMPDAYRSGVNAVIPIVLGILSTGLFTYQQTRNVWVSVAAGLGSGGVASSARDIDKNLTRIVETVYGLLGKKAGS
jgi:hypothetical protein